MLMFRNFKEIILFVQIFFIYFIISYTSSDLVSFRRNPDPGLRFGYDRIRICITFSFMFSSQPFSHLHCIPPLSNFRPTTRRLSLAVQNSPLKSVASSLRSWPPRLLFTWSGAAGRVKPRCPEILHQSGTEMRPSDQQNTYLRKGTVRVVISVKKDTIVRVAINHIYRIRGLANKESSLRPEQLDQPSLI